MHVGFHDTER